MDTGSQQIQQWPIEEIIPYTHNPKLHELTWILKSIQIGLPDGLSPDEQKRIIADRLIDQPIVVDRGGVVIKGHGRLKAAHELALETFPVIVRDDLSPEEVKLARIADNRSSEGPYNPQALLEELSELHTLFPDIDFDAFGMGEEWIEEMSVMLPSDINVDDLFVDHQLDSSGNTPPPEILTCPHCGEKFEREGGL